MRVTITLDVYDECVDEDDSTGITQAAFESIHDALSSVGEDIEIRREEI